MYNSQINPAKTTKNTTRFIGYGIIFGTFFGVVFGNFYKYQVPPIIIGIIVCMGIGFILGRKKDQEVNDQLNTHAYAVKKSTYNKEKNLYMVTIVDKKNKEKTIEIKADKYKSMELKKAELVFLNKKDQISPAYSHTREKKHKSILDIAEGYQQVKEEKDDVKKEETSKENEK